MIQLQPKNKDLVHFLNNATLHYGGLCCNEILSKNITTYCNKIKNTNKNVQHIKQHLLIAHIDLIRQSRKDKRFYSQYYYN